MKICSKCKEKKDLSEFNKNHKNKDGYYPWCKICKKEQDNIYYQANKQKLIIINTKWTKNNKQKRLKLDKKWRINNVEKIKDINKKYRKNNPHYKIRNLWHNLKRKNFNITNKKDDYYIMVKQHIESQFIEGMNWSNIEIDHKIPVTWFKNETSSDIINNLNNLQPLYINDNRTKFNKTSSPITLNFYIMVKQHIKEKYIERIHIENKIN